MTLCVKLLGQDIPSGQTIFVRGLISALVLGLIAWRTNRLHLLKTGNWRGHALRSLSGTVSMFFLFTAVTMIPLADVTAITFTSPMFITVLAMLFLGEKIHRYRWTALLLGFIGVLIMIGPTLSFGTMSSMGSLSALGAAFFAAIAMTSLRAMSGGEHAITITFYFSLTFMICAALTALQGWPMPTATQTLLIVLAGLFGVFGQLLMTYSYRYAEASTIAPLEYTSMILSIILGYVFFSEIPNVYVSERRAARHLRRADRPLARAIPEEADQLAGPRGVTMAAQPRIQLIDGLRGFALMGLFFVHMAEYYEVYWANPVPSAIRSSVFFLFGTKAYAVFSLLFGVSFYILMEGQARRGVDFRGRFVWRLMLLLGLGYLHSFLYGGDILTVLALTGLILVPLYRWGNVSLLVLAALLVLQGPLLLLHALGLQWEPGVHRILMEAYMHGSLADVMRVNSWAGHLDKWSFTLSSGRLANTIGLSLVGFVLGRTGFFVDLERYRRLHRTLLAVLLALSVALLSLSRPVDEFAGRLFDAFTNTSLALLTVMGLVALYRFDAAARALNLLAPCGRMTLTIYVSQSLLFIPFFYGFGAGAYAWIGQPMTLALALVMWPVQVWLAHLWFRSHQYGPLEWLWRAATFLRTDIPFRKVKHPMQRL